ncbi:unnamed protein product [Spirodela intermedia]|uniref:X8 domain-containing protein n=1 Tax=Spirodela intermedia TaxID=51605 RepID=A0A7I8L2T0_SPIIN|nr:unnamed protein product [Spirodela intermedia]
MAALQLSLLVLFFPILGLAGAGQEGVIKFVGLHGSATFLELHRPGYGASAPAMAVSVAVADLPAVSSSVLQAETWLRRHVLSVFPSGNVTAIVVGRGVLCTTLRAPQWDMVLPSVKNLHHSLLRWGLEREIMVSAAFSSDCLGHHSAVKTLKPLLTYLWRSNSSYLVDPPPSSSSLGATHSLVSAHKLALENLGFSPFMEIWTIMEGNTFRRSLSSSFASSPGFSSENPTPSSPPFASAPDGSFSFVPAAAPSEIPDDPPPAGFSAAAPPCSAAPLAAPGGWEAERGPSWCVAKPTAIPEALQEAMDYACGEGGADCEEIKPHGSCFYPDHIIAHASFAFNSYWQKSKKTGGSCDFQGTAALINSDPSFLHCRYVLG